MFEKRMQRMGLHAISGGHAEAWHITELVLPWRMPSITEGGYYHMVSLKLCLQLLSLHLVHLMILHQVIDLIGMAYWGCYQNVCPVTGDAGGHAEGAFCLWACSDLKNKPFSMPGTCKYLGQMAEGKWGCRWVEDIKKLFLSREVTLGGLITHWE